MSREFWSFKSYLFEHAPARCAFPLVRIFLAILLKWILDSVFDPRHKNNFHQRFLAKRFKINGLIGDRLSFAKSIDNLQSRDAASKFKNYSKIEQLLLVCHSIKKECFDVRE